MNRSIRRTAAFAVLIGSLTHVTLVLGQQRTAGNPSQGQVAPRQARGGSPGVERAANLQLPSNEGWQRGEEPSRGSAQRLPPNQAQRAGAPQPRMPFVLTQQEEAHLDQILIAWERQSSTIKTYKCDFTRWEYGTTFGQNPKDKDKPLTESKGELKYSAPDKGMFKVASIDIYNAKTGEYTKGGPESLEHWVCDGKSIFEIDHKWKTRTEQPLPPHMQGQAISDGPLPFVFGAKAATLKQRYWMRDITPPANAVNQIWLKAHPRFQADAANFKFVEIIIGRADFMPQAIKMYSPAFDPERGNESSTVFQFDKISFNRPLANFFGDFVEPPLPFGYKKIVLQPTVQQQPVQQPRAPQPTAGNTKSPRENARSARTGGGPTAR